MTQIAVRVKESSGKQPVAILKRNDLTTMKMKQFKHVSQTSESVAFLSNVACYDELITFLTVPALADFRGRLGAGTSFCARRRNLS